MKKNNMIKSTKKKELMTQINEKMNEAIINDDFDKIENIALNPNHAYIKVIDVNLFTGKARHTHRWVDISNVNDDYFEDLSSDCQDYVMSLDKYKNMDYDTMIDLYDGPIEKRNNKELEWFKKQINQSNKKSA
jgi:hypothetical protein